MTEVGATLKTAGATIKPKKKFCKDGPRCKRCPVFCKKLMKAGYLDRAGSKYIVLDLVTKRELKAARAR